MASDSSLCSVISTVSPSSTTRVGPPGRLTAPLLVAYPHTVTVWPPAGRVVLPLAA